MQNKPAKSKTIFRIILLSALFVVGVVAGKLIDLPYFKIQKKIDLISIISISATLFAAWYIAKIIDKEKVENRSEKDLILKRTEDIYKLVDESYQKIVLGKIVFQEAATHLKRINISIGGIYRTLDQVNLVTDLKIRANILSNTRKLRDLLTNTPILDDGQIQGSNLPIEIKHGIIHLNKNRIAEIESEYDKLKDNILLMQLSINRA